MKQVSCPRGPPFTFVPEEAALADAWLVAPAGAATVRPAAACTHGGCAAILWQLVYISTVGWCAAAQRENATHTGGKGFFAIKHNPVAAATTAAAAVTAARRGYSRFTCRER